jgi:16S rRNA (adenine1518-N6/adenine1519-N6)-dimethyltransferase
MAPLDAGAESTPSRLDPRTVRRLLDDTGLTARHALSQNFLADVEVLERILQAAAPSPGDRVLEIGPGLGILTGGLLAAGAGVTAVELDSRLAGHLRERFAAAIRAGEAVPGSGPERGSLRLIEGDALDQDLVNLVAPPYDVVANLPYHITSPILHALLGEPPRPHRLVLMVQREVAERIAAAPGAMSYLSVFVQYHASARVLFRVAREAFEPAPEVESAVIELQPYVAGRRLGVPTEPVGAAGGAEAGRVAVAPKEGDDFWRLVQAGFRERRKMLRNVLVRQLPIDEGRLHGALETAGIAPDRRPQTLSVDEWLALHRALGPIHRALSPPDRAPGQLPAATGRRQRGAGARASTRSAHRT